MEAKSFLAGGCGGVSATVVGHPFDTIKVRLQTQSATNPLYRGTWDCVGQTVKKEGVRALYKGMGAPLVGTAPIFAISFYANAMGQKMQQRSRAEVLGPHQLAMAGGFSGVMTTIVMAPGERVKCLLQVQQAGLGAGQAQYSGPVDVVRSLYRQGGLRSIFKGSAATAARDGPASAAFFASYELIQRWMSGPERCELSVGKTLFAGGVAGICNWVVAIPVDVVKSRLQAAPEGVYSGAVDVFLKLLRAEGVGALWKGAVPVLMRAFPANAACFLGYEAAMLGLNQVAPSL